MTKHHAFAALLDKYIEAIYVEAESQSAMCFDADWRGKVYIATDADCCSETWFADVVGVSNLIGQHVIGIELLDLPQPEDERTRQDSDQAYGVRLTTPKGRCEIVYRNSSNGYYGGSSEPMSEEDGAKLTWVQITEDWSA